jgi:RNA polymerase sigma-70 factor (ECF subfamily)
MCGDRHDAEDLVQETYVRVLGRRRVLRSDDDIGYLLRALRNTHVSRLRAAGARPEPQTMPDPPERTDPRPSWQPQQAIEASELFAAIAGLDQPFREAIVAIDVAGLSYREAARALRVREATITSRLHRARLRVADALEEGAQP